MVHAHLRHRAQIAPPLAPDAHLDEDSLSAFTEGRLSENETAPVLKHLVACAFCRHITAQLVRLDSEVGDAKDMMPVTVDDPGRIRRFLDDLGSRTFGPPEDEAVFAYHAPADDFKAKEEKNDTSSESADEKVDNPDSGSEGPATNKS